MWAQVLFYVPGAASLDTKNIIQYCIYCTLVALTVYDKESRYIGKN
jgi:hypothetical protein